MYGSEDCCEIGLVSRPPPWCALWNQEMEVRLAVCALVAAACAPVAAACAPVTAACGTLWRSHLSAASAITQPLPSASLKKGTLSPLRRSSRAWKTAPGSSALPAGGAAAPGAERTRAPEPWQRQRWSSAGKTWMPATLTGPSASAPCTPLTCLATELPRIVEWLSLVRMAWAEDPFCGVIVLHALIVLAEGPALCHTSTSSGMTLSKKPPAATAMPCLTAFVNSASNESLVKICEACTCLMLIDKLTPLPPVAAEVTSEGGTGCAGAPTLGAAKGARELAVGVDVLLDVVVDMVVEVVTVVVVGVVVVGVVVDEVVDEVVDVVVVVTDVLEVVSKQFTFSFSWHHSFLREDQPSWQCITPALQSKGFPWQVMPSCSWQ